MADGTTAAKRRRARGPTTPDPIEIAMEAEASGGAPAGVAHEVLRKQSLLLGWQAARERAAFALTLAGALVGLAVAMLLGAMVWRAAHADGVVVRPFTTPADLAADGLSGEALAARVLDRIDALRLRTGATLMQRATGFQGADELAGCRDVAECVADLSDEESRAFAEALRAELGKSGDL